MNRSNANPKRETGRIGWALIVALGFLGIAGATGCDQYTNWMSWGNLINPWYTSSLGLPAMPAMYYPFLFM